jgi:predicted nucleotidyltransferase
VSSEAVFSDVCGALQHAVTETYASRLVSLVVFGSVGRGTARPDSDLDFLLIARDLPRGRWQRMTEFQGVEQRLEPALKRAREQGVVTCLSPILKTPEEAERGSPLFLDMVEDARVLVDEQGFFGTVLGHLRSRLERLGARRVWRGARWYWDLKPDYLPGDVIEL